MEDKEHERKLKLHKIGKVIKLFVICPIIFASVNAALNYFVLFEKMLKLKNKAKLPPDFWSFKLRYLYTETKHMPLYFIAAIAFLGTTFLIMRMETSWQVKYGSANLKADDRFMTDKEIAKSFQKVNVKKLKKAKVGGIPVAQKGNTLYLDTENIHTLIIGATRSGKGQLLVLPLYWIISMVKNKQSFVTNDMKADNIENVYSILKDNDYRIFVLNLDNADHSEEWDLLYEAKKEYVKVIVDEEPDLSSCMKIIESIASLFTDNPKSDPVWPDSAHALLVAMILYMFEEGHKNGKLDKVTMPSVYRFFVTYGEHDEIIDKVRVNALDEIFHNLPVDDPARASYASSNFAKGEMRASIFSILASNLKVFSSDMGIQKITSGNTIDFSKIVTDDKPCAVFIILPDEDRSRDMIASAFVNQCYDYLVKQAKQYPRKMLPRRVQFILDEFANMPRIPAMSNKVSIGAGHNILFTLVVQDLNQLDERYGKSAKSIRGNCGNVIYINSIDKDTNQYISAIMGSKQYDITSYSGKLHEWLNQKSVSHETKPLMTATQLGRLSKGKAVIIKQRSYPILTKFKPFYKYKLPVIPINKIPLHQITRKLKDSFYPIEDFQKAIGMNVVNNSSDVKAVFNNTQFDFIDTDEENEETNENRAVIDKFDDITNGRFKEEIHSGNIKRAEELAKIQFKIKKINKEELDIILSELSQYY